MSVKMWLLLPLLATACWAQNNDVAKPVCNAQTRGTIWPDKSAHATNTPVEICAAHRSKYEWRQLTVDVSQLIASARKSAAPPQAAVQTTAARPQPE